MKIEKLCFKKKETIPYINNDRTPSLGNEILTESSLSKEEFKKRKSLLASISNILIKNISLRGQIRETAKNLQDVSIQDLNHDGRIDQSDIGLDQAKKINGKEY